METGALGDPGWCSPIDVAARLGFKSAVGHPFHIQSLIDNQIATCRIQQADLIARRAAAGDRAAQDDLALLKQIEAAQAANARDQQATFGDLLIDSAKENLTNPGKTLGRGIDAIGTQIGKALNAISTPVKVVAGLGGLAALALIVKATRG
jgi:hypothetical protein